MEEKISNMKGVNIPDTFVKMSSLTKKDIKDLELCLDLSLDYVALSFVQKAKDLIDLKKYIGNQTGIMAKFEKPLAIKRMDEILLHCDAAMVARGDLGVEMPPEEVPIIQKRIVQSCRDFGKPVVVATQMLDSMINSPSPTRAEASDVATAVFDAADSLMLSAETASGKFPVESVQIMDRIIRGVENDISYRQILESKKIKLEETTSDAISSCRFSSCKNSFSESNFYLYQIRSNCKKSCKRKTHCPYYWIIARQDNSKTISINLGCSHHSCIRTNEFFRYD